MLNMLSLQSLQYDVICYSISSGLFLQSFPAPHLQYLQHSIDFLRHPQTFLRAHLPQLQGNGNSYGIIDFPNIFGIKYSSSVRKYPNSSGNISIDSTKGELYHVNV